jgi:hypothetical protein
LKKDRTASGDFIEDIDDMFKPDESQRSVSELGEEIGKEEGLVAGRTAGYQ